MSYLRWIALCVLILSPLQPSAQSQALASQDQALQNAEIQSPPPDTQERQPQVEPIPPPVNALALPTQLKENGQFDFCATEALRLAYQTPQYEVEGVTLAAQCLQLDGQYQGAEALFASLKPAIHQGKISPEHRDELSFQRCMGQFFHGVEVAHQKTLSGLENCLYDPANQGVDTQSKGQYALVMADLWQNATPQNMDLDPWAQNAPAPLRNWALEDQNYQNHWQNLPRKSPLLAGVLSALIPGLGKVYLGKASDAGLSFAVVVSPLLISGLTYRKNQALSPLSIIGATVAAGMYAGNIYGSYIGAKAHNLSLEEELRHDALYRYHQRLSP